MSTRHVIVIGAGGHAKVVIATLQAAGRIVDVIVDEDEMRLNDVVLGIKVVGSLNCIQNYSDLDAIIAVGENETRRRISKEYALNWTTTIHPRSVVHEGVTLGPGTVVFAGAVVQPGACIGAHTIINTSATVDHDCTLGDFVHMAPGSHLGGGVSIGDGAFIGIGAAVLPNCRVGEWAVLGGAALAIRNVESNSVSVGVPATIIRRITTSLKGVTQEKLQFQIWNAADPLDRKAWTEFWARWPEREVFGHPDYVRLYASPRAHAFCAGASFGESYILYPFLLQSLADKSYGNSSLCDCTDIATPYGYGGPFRWGAALNPEAVRAFWQELDAWATKSCVVSEIIRFSLFPGDLVEYPGDRRVRYENVVLTIKSEDELWRDFEHKVRKNVNKARSNGVTVQIDEKGDRLDDFLAIYTDTMNRRNANESYYFPREYFERIHKNLKGQFAYFHAFVGGAVIATELVLVSANRVYSFLGGTYAAWFHVRPNELLKVEIINWARNAGKTQFVLGGGYSSNDGIYRYKLSFAPNGSVPFSLGSRVLRPDAYEQLLHVRRAFETSEGRQWQPDPQYFPAYRG